MLENFDNIWGIVILAVGAIVPIITLIVQATPTPRDDEVWGKIALIIGRIFGAKSFRDPVTGKSNWSMPVLQSAKPKQ